MAIYLLSKIEPPSPKPFTSIDPPLSGNFAAVMGLRVTMRQIPKGGKGRKFNWWDKRKKHVKIRSRVPPPGAIERISFNM